MPPTILSFQRFASIMILSVLRNTNSTVKFWFIENFLSPSFLVGGSFSFNFSGMIIAMLGIYPASCGCIQFQIRASDIQMAVVASCSKREATHHLGIQDPFPRCSLPHGSQEGHF